MLRTPFPTVALVLLASLWLAPGCVRQIPVQQFPPSVDLQVQPKPVLDPDALTSDKALNDYDASVESWGAAGWLQVSRLCHWAKAVGMKDAPCRD